MFLNLYIGLNFWGWKFPKHSNMHARKGSHQFVQQNSLYIMWFTLLDESIDLNTYNLSQRGDFRKDNQTRKIICVFFTRKYLLVKKLNHKKSIEKEQRNVEWPHVHNENLWFFVLIWVFLLVCFYLCLFLKRSKEVVRGQFHVMRDWWCYFRSGNSQDGSREERKSLFAKEQQDNPFHQNLLHHAKHYCQ